MRRRAGPTGGACRKRLRLAGTYGVVALAYVLTGALLCVAQSQAIDVSGRFGLDTAMIPMPATLIDAITLNTPAQRTLLEFEVEASLEFTATWNAIELHWDSAINIAGPERVIIDGKIPLGPVTIAPELWFAVPFETVIDVNHCVNWVVIPPGELMFVKTRWRFEASYGEIDFNVLFLLEDVSFPNPGADFGSLFYPLQSQSFRYGSIIRASAEVAPGVTLTSVTNINADSGSNAVKGHSASGRAYRSCDPINDSWFNETLTLNGLEYCGVPFWVSMKVDPLASPVLDFAGGGSLVVGMFGLDLAGSISLFPVSVSGFSFSGNVCDAITVRVNLSEHLRFQSASFRCSSSLDIGLMMLYLIGSSSVTAGGGIPGLELSASVTQGTFSGGLTVAITDQLGRYRLSSFAARLSVSQAPVAYSVSVDFGRTGLLRAALSIGVVF